MAHSHGKKIFQFCKVCIFKDVGKTNILTWALDGLPTTHCNSALLRGDTSFCPSGLESNLTQLWNCVSTNQLKCSAPWNHFGHSTSLPPSSVPLLSQTYNPLQTLVLPLKYTFLFYFASGCFLPTSSLSSPSLPSLLLLICTHLWIFIQMHTSTSLSLPPPSSWLLLLPHFSVPL